MCVNCIIRDKNGRIGAIKTAVTNMHNELAIGVLTPANPREIKEHYVTSLRETADRIEQALRDEDAINAATKAHMAHLATIKVAVDKEMLSKEASFYAEYGIPIPDELRSVMLSRVWIEQQSKFDAEQRRNPTIH